jgi:hypothetical protein
MPWGNGPAARPALLSDKRCFGSATGKKKPRIAGPFFDVAEGLLQLRFLVFDVLASLGIELHDRHFLGHRLLVLARGVEVAGSRSGFQLDLFASAFASHGAAPVWG